MAIAREVVMACRMGVEVLIIAFYYFLLLLPFIHVGVYFLL